MRPVRPAALALLALGLFPPVLVRAQDEPVTAGSDGVPVPQRTRLVRPVYPQEAQAQGIRGIVILELVIDTQGHVSSATVIRSVPGLDEAALGAARQWEYEVTKVAGRPVSVRVTVPITFALRLPEVAREDGIPELRQGVAPRWPEGAEGSGSATAEVTLEPDGRIGVARVVEGDAPWSEALLQALQTWRFALPPVDETLAFRVRAEFGPSRGKEQPGQVRLRASGLQRSTASLSPADTGPASEPAPTTGVPAASDAGARPAAASPEGASTPSPAAPPAPAVAPSETVPPPAPIAAAPTTTAPPAPAPAPVPSAPSPAPGGEEAARSPESGPIASAPAIDQAAPAPPPVEVITAPPPPQPAESGVSAIRDVTLEPGVPDLARGRRPVAPPLARMAGTTGEVLVLFSVSGGGNTSVQSVSGPDLLKAGAEQTVTSWVFRRTRADRAYLVAVFTFSGDRASAVVRPQPQAP